MVFGDIMVTWGDFDGAAAYTYEVKDILHPAKIFPVFAMDFRRSLRRPSSLLSPIHEL